MTDHVRLREYETTESVRLTTVEREVLADAGVAASHIVGTKDRYDLRPGATVGVLRLADRQFHIRPKLGIRRLLYLAGWTDHVRWLEDVADLDVDDSLLDVMASVYARRLDAALSQGVVRGYRTVEERGFTVRGRIDIAAQVRREHGRMIPINVIYDDHTVDTEMNRILLAAIARLRGLELHDTAARRLLLRSRDRLDGVTPIKVDARRLPAIPITRLNAHFAPALGLARLILQASTIEARKGETRGDAMLFNMNEVFEQFVIRALRSALRLTTHDFPSEGKGRRLRLDTRGRIALKPDLSWWEGRQAIFVGDVKYKKVSIQGFLHPDVYQVHAYARATGLPSAVLVYAKGEEEAVTHQIVRDGPTIEVIPIDLERDIPGITAEIERVAARVRHHADLGRAVIAQRKQTSASQPVATVPVAI